LDLSIEFTWLNTDAHMAALFGAVAADPQM
jgi:hypothetical protein